MIKMDIQFFGGRGAGSGMSGGGSLISTPQVLNLPSGSKISVQHFSSITGKPDGQYVEYTKNGAWWSSVSHGSFRNSTTDINKLNSINGIVPKIKQVK